jgi:hypothetical protein
MRVLVCALIVLDSLVGVAAAQAWSPGPQRACRDGAAQFAIGHRYSAKLAERARLATHAALTRNVAPGQVYTMEFRADRLNFDLDRRGIVRRVRCG